MLLTFGVTLFSQNKTEANEKINEGIKAHDKGEYKIFILIFWIINQPHQYKNCD
jgi:hypothetical protein